MSTKVVVKGFGVVGLNVVVAGAVAAVVVGVQAIVGDIVIVGIVLALQFFGRLGEVSSVFGLLAFGDAVVDSESLVVVELASDGFVHFQRVHFEHSDVSHLHG